MRKFMNAALIVLCLCLIAGTGAFLHNARSSYEIDSNFVSLPLQFDPEDSSSTYQSDKAEVTVYGGFVKGLYQNKNGMESLVVRALSPIPVIAVTGANSDAVSIRLENVNPDFYAASIQAEDISMTKLTVNTLQLDINIGAGERITIAPSVTSESEEFKVIILGDNRDGYDTFEQIIEQVNGEEPVFVIDNGDLVYSGKPNQYRLFDKLVSQISTTLCTTLGNHDIRGDGRSIYTMLYGPPYYSFDYADTHFAFLDSSPGWTEQVAISEEQYAWLERDLEKAQGKQIFVVTHIPPYDPREGVTENEIPNYVAEIESGNSWLEQKLSDYSVSKSMDHGFQDPEETKRFEELMSQYKVDTVYLSHIHSYLEYTKDDVRYLITGGAGAELLSGNSYYHYMIERVGSSKSSTIVELPSPANNYVARYGATVQLFAKAIYQENPFAVILLITGFVLLLILILAKIYLWRSRHFQLFGRWLKDVAKYAVKRFKEIYSKT